AWKASARPRATMTIAAPSTEVARGPNPRGRRFGDRAMSQLWIVWSSLWLAACAASAEEAVSFRDKTITVIVASSSGGGTDTSARVIAPLLANRLPGKPTVIVRNIP